MKDFLLTQVMTEQQVKDAMDNNHAVIGHTTFFKQGKEGEHVTVVRQWRLKADGVFTNRYHMTSGGRMSHTEEERDKAREIVLAHPQSDGKLNDKTISRLHFLLEWLPIEDEVSIRDTSTNGTFVNGQKIKPYREHLLKDGDEILVGETRLLFEKIESRLLFEKIE